MNSSHEAYASIVMENKTPSRNQSSNKNLDPSTGFDCCKRGKRNSFNINSFHHRTQNQNGRHHWRKTRLSKVEPRSVSWIVSIGHSYKSYANESLLFYFDEMYNVLQPECLYVVLFCYAFMICMLYQWFGRILNLLIFFLLHIDQIHLNFIFLYLTLFSPCRPHPG